MTGAPFPWFGGKSRAAAEVWAALGDVDNYVEPFFGSGAVLLGRPNKHRGRIETVNDADGLLCNVWRAMAAAPDEVAKHADWPVSEADLSARHLWLIGQRERITERLQVDPDYYDAKAAGWWVWGACCWIGSGWCSGDGPWATTDGKAWSHLGDAGQGIHRKLPHLGNAGRGIHRKLPHLGNAGQGIHRQLPHLGNAGQGIHRQLPHLGDAGRGIATWFDHLSVRLRRVRMCCGDWSRVVTPSVTHRHGLTGVFLDPPYPDGWSPDAAYAGQTGDVAALWAAVVSWAEEAGRHPDMRIVLAGYAGAGAVPAGWREIRWTPRKGYARNDNSDRERLWLSPHCLHGPQVGLFG